MKIEGTGGSYQVSVSFGERLVRQIVYRTKEFLTKVDVDPCEIMSAMATGWLAYVLFRDPDYIMATDRLRSLGNVAGFRMALPYWGAAFGIACAWQTMAFFLGGPPALLVTTPEQKLRWLWVRFIGYLNALLVLLIAALSMGTQGVTFVGGLLWVFVLGNVFGAWRTAALISAEMEKSDLLRISEVAQQHQEIAMYRHMKEWEAAS